MPLILNIDTATENAHISLAEDGEIKLYEINTNQKDHAAFLQPAIKTLFENCGVEMQNIDAVAVTAGPGSYTGLRVGMASAKGICYALKKPLICVNTLEVMALSALEGFRENGSEAIPLLCPMLDARRMEVYTAIYNCAMEVILAPCAMVLNAYSFDEILKKEQIVFFGNGSIKWKTVCTSTAARFETVTLLPQAFSQLTNKYFLNNQFSHLALSQPFYLKEFYNAAVNP
jgi:tRNA threonylcarbamoyladenosine biosynthesis protein TsaB